MVSDAFFFPCCLSGKLLFLIGLRKKRGGELRETDTFWKHKGRIFCIFDNAKEEGGRGGQCVSGRRRGEPFISVWVLWMLPVSLRAKACCCICQCCSGMCKTNLLGLHCIAQGVMSHDCHRLWAVMIDSLAGSWTRPALPVAERPGRAGTAWVPASSLFLVILVFVLI